MVYIKAAPPFLRGRCLLKRQGSSHRFDSLFGLSPRMGLYEKHVSPWGASQNQWQKHRKSEKSLRGKESIFPFSVCSFYKSTFDTSTFPRILIFLTCCYNLCIDIVNDCQRSTRWLGDFIYWFLWSIILGIPWLTINLQAGVVLCFLMKWSYRHGYCVLGSCGNGRNALPLYLRT